MQDNQIITANDLNNISTDLGNATFSYFSDGKPYAITELNNITKEIVTAGILNIWDKCECVPNDDNTVTVKTGVIVFSDGCKIRIEEEKTLLLADPNAKNYIFAEHSAEFDNVVLKCSTATTENECIILCEIENGKITDKRETAKAKCAIPVLENWNTTQTIVLSETFTTTAENKTKRLEIPINGDTFNYIILPLTDGCMSVFDIKKQTGNICWNTDGGNAKGDITNNIIWKDDASNDRYYRIKTITFVAVEYGKLILDLLYDYVQYSNYSENDTWGINQTIILC